MNALRVAGAILFSVLILATGFWLGVAGRPFNSALLNAHKLISLAAVVLLGITAFQVNRASGLAAPQITSLAATGILLLAAVVSGGLSSIDTVSRTMVMLHRVSLSLAGVSTALTLYLLLRGK